MNFWRKWVSPLGLGLCLLILGGGCQNPFRQPPLVGIISWNQEMESIRDNCQGIFEGLREEGYLEGINVRLRMVNAAGDRARAAAAAEKFEAQGARLLITVGTVPTLVALDSTQGSRLPVVYSSVGAPDATGLKWEARDHPRFTGTSSEVPMSQQVEMFRLALPDMKRLGILFCTATPVAVATGMEAEAAARQLGLEVVKATVTDDRPELVDQALTHLLGRQVQGVFVPDDPVLSSPKNLEGICQRLLAARVPAMAPYGSSVVYGALLSYHADFAEVGRQAGRQAARILSGAAPDRVPPEIPWVKRLTLNLRVAQLLEINLSRRLLSRAHELY
jgi:putative tryptophan/tyrosine transport system substrate-binding protein